MNTPDLSAYRGKRITVMGLGRFGGGIGAARWLAGLGAEVTITDMKSADALAESVAALAGVPVTFHLGGHEMADFTDADMVVASPAVPRESTYLTAARDAGVSCQTEIGLFVTHCPAPICGVTGSNGKTTTVSMIGAILDADGGPHRVGGNIGVSLLDDLAGLTPDHRIVLELSSFQLEWLDDLGWSPQVASILNLSPNHLDRHGTIEQYAAAKAAILDHQSADDTAVLVADPPGSLLFRDHVRGHLLMAGTGLDSDGVTISDGQAVIRRDGIEIPLFDISSLQVPGCHNLLNALAAAACASAMGIEPEAVASGLASFQGVPHRIQFVGERGGIRFYNDSKATTPESTVVAVTSFDSRVIPILGGYDKGVTFDGMAENIAGRVPWAALIGVTAPAIEAALTSQGIPSTVYASLEDAFNGCVEHAGPGDVVLLSPGCASWDMFSDYEERGARFIGLAESFIAG